MSTCGTFTCCWISWIQSWWICVSLGRRGEAEDCGRQAGSGETGDSCESELLHFSAFFSYLWGSLLCPLMV